MLKGSDTARIILEDGTEFEGSSFGYAKAASGEVIVYSGFPDCAHILTDPAMKDAIVVLSHPMAGVEGFLQEELCPYGLDKHYESSEAQIAGLVVPAFSPLADHWDAHKTIHLWLRKYRVPAISGVDTRAIVQRVSRRGAMRAKIMNAESKDISFSSAGRQAHPSFVSVKQPLAYGSGNKKILAVDCGLRNTTLRILIDSGCTIQRVPWNYDYSKEHYDGLFLAGGPGDPTECERAIAILSSALPSGKPVMGIGLGAVLLALAGGASACKLTQGHYNPAIPCIDRESGKCVATAQNHHFGIRDGTLPQGWDAAFINNTDGSIEGFSASDGMITGFFFLPEGISGKAETINLYNRFFDQVGDRA